MVRISSARAELRCAVPAATVHELIEAIGTERYPATCLQILDDSCDADHWALFHYSCAGVVRCVASASKVHAAAARSNVEQFVNRCHRVDPSLIAVRRQHLEPACVAEMQVGDIVDPQYRSCFEVAGVHERISLFLRLDTGLHQLSIFRGSHTEALEGARMRNFAALAGIIVRSTTKHERLASAAGKPPALSVESIERLLRQSPFLLSQRESEVCALAAAGRTIDQSAGDLRIARTSIVTYRERAYDKLNVSRQSELVALINNMRRAAT